VAAAEVTKRTRRRSGRKKAQNAQKTGVFFAPFVFFAAEEIVAKMTEYAA